MNHAPQENILSETPANVCNITSVHLMGKYKIYIKRDTSREHPCFRVRETETDVFVGMREENEEGLANLEDFDVLRCPDPFSSFTKDAEIANLLTTKS